MPARLATLLRHRVANLEQLRALLWLAGEPGAVVTPKELAAELGIADTRIVTAALVALVDAELVAYVGSDGARFQYAPRSSDFHEDVQLLAAAYSERRATIERLFAPA